MKKCLFIVLALLTCTSLQHLAAQTPSAESAKPQKFGITFGPYLQQVDTNGATIVWGTSSDALSWVEVASDGKEHFYAKSWPQYYSSMLGRRQIGRLHRVHIDALQPATTYRYRVCSREVTVQTAKEVDYGRTVCSDVYRRQPHTFRTVNPEQSTLSMLMVNDIHARTDVLADLTKNVRKEAYDFVFFNGDMVSHMDSEQQLIDGFLGKAVELFAADIPFYYARGNHETRGNFANRYMDYFPSPTGVPYYLLRRGPVCFIVLDSGEDKPDSDVEYYGLADFDRYREQEAQWLRQALASDEYRTAPFKVVVTHVPPTTLTWHGPLEVKRLFTPLLNDAKVDVMLCGHLHRYGLITDSAVSGCNFPVLINSNSTAVELKADDEALHMRVLATDGSVTATLTLPRRK